MAGIDNNTLLYLRGDSFTDLSLKNNSITNSSVTIVDDDYVNKCFDFNSSNKHLVLNDVNLFNFGSSNFTIEFYMKLPTGNLNGYHLFGKRTTASSNLSSTCFFNDTTLDFILSINGTTSNYVIQIPHSTFIRNEWYHIAYIRDGNYIKMFINGELSGIKSFTESIYNSSEKFKIGAVNSTAGGFFKGWLAHFRISNIARYTEDFIPPTKPFNSININVTNQTEDKIDFNISKLGQEVVNKVEILHNNQSLQTYNSIGDLTYNIDRDVLGAGGNVTIKVTFDDIYTEEKEVYIESNITQLPSSSSLKEIIDKQEQLDNAISIQRDILRDILISKNIEVFDDENKLSVLINKVDKLKSGAKLYLFKDGDECVDITGGFVDTGTSNGSMINDGTSLVITANKHSSGYKFAFANTNKLISFKGYSTLKVDCSLDIKDITNSSVVMGVHTSKGAYPSERFVLNKNNLSRTIVSLHVEDITTDRYFIVRPMIESNSTATSVTCRIYKIWLEA